MWTRTRRIFGAIYGLACSHSRKQKRPRDNSHQPLNSDSKSEKSHAKKRREITPTTHSDSCVTPPHPTPIYPYSQLWLRWCSCNPPLEDCSSQRCPSFDMACPRPLCTLWLPRQLTSDLRGSECHILIPPSRANQLLCPAKSKSCYRGAPYYFVRLLTWPWYRSPLAGLKPFPKRESEKL